MTELAPRNSDDRVTHLESVPTAAEVVEHLPTAEEVLGRRTITCLEKSPPGYAFKGLLRGLRLPSARVIISTEIKNQHLCCT